MEELRMWCSGGAFFQHARRPGFEPQARGAHGEDLGYKLSYLFIWFYTCSLSWYSWQGALRTALSWLGKWKRVENPLHIRQRQRKYLGAHYKIETSSFWEVRQSCCQNVAYSKCGFIFPTYWIKMCSLKRFWRIIMLLNITCGKLLFLLCIGLFHLNDLFLLMMIFKTPCECLTAFA